MSKNRTVFHHCDIGTVIFDTCLRENAEGFPLTGFMPRVTVNFTLPRRYIIIITIITGW